jgi:hypothetical protein
MVWQGVLQAVGVIVSIVGISRYMESAPDQPPERRMTLQLIPTPGGAFGGLTARF